MFSGLQELLVILLIIAFLFLLPRLMQRGRKNSSGASTFVQPKLSLSRSLRLAVVLTVLWLLVSLGYFQPWKGDTSPFLYVAIVPVAAVWGAIWIAYGRRKHRPED